MAALLIRRPDGDLRQLRLGSFFMAEEPVS
jgi:hypothetical protein